MPAPFPLLRKFTNQPKNFGTAAFANTLTTFLSVREARKHYSGTLEHLFRRGYLLTKENFDALPNCYPYFVVGQVSRSTTRDLGLNYISLYDQSMTRGSEVPFSAGYLFRGPHPQPFSAPWNRIADPANPDDAAYSVPTTADFGRVFDLHTTTGYDTTELDKLMESLDQPRPVDKVWLTDIERLWSSTRALRPQA